MGCSECGFTHILAVRKPPPTKTHACTHMQADWEALLAQHPQHFIDAVGSWLLPPAARAATNSGRGQPHGGGEAGPASGAKPPTPPTQAAAQGCRPECPWGSSPDAARARTGQLGHDAHAGPPAQDAQEGSHGQAAHAGQGCNAGPSGQERMRGQRGRHAGEDDGEHQQGAAPPALCRGERLAAAGDSCSLGPTAGGEGGVGGLLPIGHACASGDECAQREAGAPQAVGHDRAVGCDAAVGTSWPQNSQLPRLEQYVGTVRQRLCVLNH